MRTNDSPHVLRTPSSMASRHRTILGTLAAVLVLSMTPRAAYGQDVSDERRLASALLDEGDRLRRNGRCDEAISRWRTGFRISGHWLFLMRIALCLETLGRYQEALDSLERGRELGWDEFSDEGRDQVLDVIQRVKAQVPARVEITANVSQARISVDGQPLGELPLPHTLELPPGRHLIEINAEGDRGGALQLDVQAGSSLTATFTLSRQRRSTRHPARDR